VSFYKVNVYIQTLDFRLQFVDLRKKNKFLCCVISIVAHLETAQCGESIL